MVFIVDWTWSVMKRMEKLSREELKTIENDISAARRAGVEVKHSDGEIPIMGIKRYGRWYDATLVNPQFILAQRRLIRMRREGIDYDTTEEDDLSIIAVELSFVDLQCMCRFSVRDASEDELMPPPPPPMPECGLEDRDESEVKLMPPPPPPPMPECWFEGMDEAMPPPPPIPVCGFEGMDELMPPPPPPPMPECGLEDIPTPIRCNRKSTICYLNELFEDMRGQCPPPPPPPVPECGLEEAKKRRRRGGRKHKGHRRA